MQRDSGASAYEFFAGGGMARHGLSGAWRVTFANDIRPEKTAAYEKAYGSAGLATGDVWSIHADDLPGSAALAWASFPCQDLSLAGSRAGLDAPRSGAFWGFWRLIEALGAQGRAPRLLALENVPGLLTSRGGDDFAALGRALIAQGYHFGAVELDAVHFVPQSRPRVFVIASACEPPPHLRAQGPSPSFHTPAIVAAHQRLSPQDSSRWVWWRLPQAPLRNTVLADLLEPDAAVPWRSQPQTEALLGQMSGLHLQKIAATRASGARAIGALFRRVRVEDGQKVQRAEVRFDGLAGCLRTPAGGSSRQMILVVEGATIRSRFLTAREGARLMGLPDTYPLPASESRALHLVGDGVVAPAVRWLSTHLLEPLARTDGAPLRAAG